MVLIGVSRWSISVKTGGEADHKVLRYHVIRSIPYPSGKSRDCEACTLQRMAER